MVVRPCTVYVCEAQPILLEGLRHLFDQTPEFRLVGSSPGLATALNDVPSLRPRLMLVENGPEAGRLQEFVIDLKRVSPESRVVVWSNSLAASESHRVLQSGVAGVFRRSLSVDLLLECLREVAAGRTWTEPGTQEPWSRPRSSVGAPRLTPREREIARLVGEGLKNREIAERLSITTGTVKVHLMHVFEKTGVTDRYALAAQVRSLLSGPTGQGIARGGRSL